MGKHVCRFYSKNKKNLYQMPAAKKYSPRRRRRQTAAKTIIFLRNDFDNFDNFGKALTSPIYEGCTTPPPQSRTALKKPRLNRANIVLKEFYKFKWVS